ncbi:serine hydrolase domain-containing protein [Streptomyces sp. NPDC002073]|uniref:serine hydrolase domain-containing protein n=1 Tax=Streptomyces sp. NBC_00239 TaxID=2903640 RepID=UPI002E2E1A7D|nr:serine hydrolase domain-containing protein [Streptomyces sp. NBC_00239]
MREQARQTWSPAGRRSGAWRGGWRRGAVAAGAAMAVAVGVPAVAGAAPAAAFAQSGSASHAPAHVGPDAVRQGLRELVRADGVPAALASVRGRDGRDGRVGPTRTYTAGVGDLATGAGVPRDGQVRIGSNTKTFTAVLVLQLVGEGRIDLDANVDTYLPGLVRGDGIDGRRISVRELLQHTSGLPNYVKYLGDEVRYYSPRQLLDIALRQKATADPGEKWEYSNTNYVLAGLIVEEVTRRPFAEELERRIIKPLGLRHTYFPAPGELTIREAHPKGYYQEAAGAPLRDGTELDPSWGWAAGQMVSTNSDLNRFFGALLSPGRLLPAAQLAEMRTTVPAGAPFAPGTGYGLGLVSTPLSSCRGVYWGHGGSTTGYETRGGATDDGRAVNIAVTTQPSDPAVMKHVDELVDSALCRGR